MIITTPRHAQAGADCSAAHKKNRNCSIRQSLHASEMRKLLSTDSCPWEPFWCVGLESVIIPAFAFKHICCPFNAARFEFYLGLSFLHLAEIQPFYALTY